MNKIQTILSYIIVIASTIMAIICLYLMTQGTTSSTLATLMFCISAVTGWSFFVMIMDNKFNNDIL